PAGSRWHRLPWRAHRCRPSSRRRPRGPAGSAPPCARRPRSAGPRCAPVPARQRSKVPLTHPTGRVQLAGRAARLRGKAWFGSLRAPRVAALLASLVLSIGGLLAMPGLPHLVPGPVDVRAAQVPVTLEKTTTAEVALPFDTSDVTLHWH